MTAQPSGPRRRAAVWLFGTAAIVAVLAFLILPQFVAARLETALARSIPGRPEVEADVGANPGVLAGRFRSVSVEARGARIDGLPVTRMSLRLRDLRVAPTPLIVRGRLVIAGLGGGSGVVVLREEDLRTYLAETKGIKNAAVTLEGGRVIVEGDVRVLNAELRVHLEGRLVVATPTTVNLQVETLTLSGLALPQEVGNALVSLLNPLFVVENLLFPARIESLEIKDGAAEMTLAVGGP